MPKKDYPEQWVESFELSATMFREAGVEWEFVDVPSDWYKSVESKS